MKNSFEYNIKYRIIYLTDKIISKQVSFRAPKLLKLTTDSEWFKYPAWALKKTRGYPVGFREVLHITFSVQLNTHLIQGMEFDLCNTKYSGL